MTTTKTLRSVFLWRFFFNQNGRSGCLRPYEDSTRLQIIQHLAGVIPLCIIIPCNIIITVKVILQIRSMRGVVAPNQQQQLKKKSIKVTILTLSITLSFTILIIPNNVFLLCCDMGSHFELVSVLTLLPFINASINCYMNALASKDFRRKLKSVFVWIWTCLTSCCTQNVVAPAAEDIPM